jgi:hypothetical protein
MVPPGQRPRSAGPAKIRVWGAVVHGGFGRPCVCMHLCVQAQGKGPMYVASCRGHAACISALADHGADVNASLVSESASVSEVK